MCHVIHYFEIFRPSVGPATNRSDLQILSPGEFYPVRSLAIGCHVVKLAIDRARTQLSSTTYR